MEILKPPSIISNWHPEKIEEQEHSPLVTSVILIDRDSRKRSGEGGCWLENRTYCCCAAKSICTSGGARAGDSTKCRLASLEHHVYILKLYSVNYQEN